MFVGKLKDSLDRVDPDLGMQEVIACFGNFVKFIVVISLLESTIPKAPSTVTVLLAAQQGIQITLPVQKYIPRNNKTKLGNAII